MFQGALHYNYNKEPQKSTGNYLGPYLPCSIAGSFLANGALNQSGYVVHIQSSACHFNSCDVSSCPRPLKASELEKQRQSKEANNFWFRVESFTTGSCFVESVEAFT